MKNKRAVEEKKLATEYLFEELHLKSLKQEYEEINLKRVLY